MVLVVEGIKFVYDEPAMVVNADGNDYLVVADLHIGMELDLSRKGIHMFGATERMSDRIKNIAKEFGLSRIIILGDVKNSILYPEAAEIKLLRGFFKQLDRFEIKVLAGNHDAHLEEIVGISPSKELVVGKMGFTHGNRRPSDDMMSLDYVVSGHEHLAVRIREPAGAVYEQKAWAIYKLNKKSAKLDYDKFNGKLKLISMPAFNDLIMGTVIDKERKGRINPVLRKNLFDYASAEIYNLMGQRIML